MELKISPREEKNDREGKIKGPKSNKWQSGHLAKLGFSGAE